MNEKLQLIAQLGDLLVKMTEAISKLGDSIAHLVTLGAQGYDAAAARKAHADLIELRADLVKLVTGVNIPVIRSINEYVEHHASANKPSIQVSRVWWKGILDKVAKAIELVNGLLQDVGKIRNDFVLENAYTAIQSALQNRLAVLMKLRGLPAPVEDDELRVLAQTGKEYQKLSEATQKASDQLADYIKLLSKQ